MLDLRVNRAGMSSSHGGSREERKCTLTQGGRMVQHISTAGWILGPEVGEVLAGRERGRVLRQGEGQGAQGAEKH